MKVLSSEGLTKLIQLIKGAFISVNDVEQASEVTLATVATTGAYSDLSGRPSIVSSVDSSSTNADAVGAKLFYDTCGDIETLINAL